MPTAAQRLNSPTLEDLLLSGGDARLALDRISGLNIYGCAPRPASDTEDYSSSTASSISEHAYARVEESWHRLSRHTGAIDTHVEDACAELKTHLQLGADEADIVFSASGTGAQLLALFLVRAMLGTPLVSIIVGADQSGSGVAYTAGGLHFADHNGFRQGGKVEGLAEGVRCVAISFCDSEGKPRGLADLDAAVTDAVGAAIAGGSHVLLQAIASSKLGWAGPSNACLEALVTRWPDKIRVVMDACQMRVGTQRLRHYLARGYIVLATGSKFFCGPAFSGALLIPAALRESINAIADVAPGLRSYGNKFDWPDHWPKIRAGFSATPNIGQWLRWEAALEEMRAYCAVPLTFRTLALHRLAETIAGSISAAPWLTAFEGSLHDPDPLRDDEFAVPSIFSFVPGNADGPLSKAQCTILYHRLTGRVSTQSNIAAAHLYGKRCQIGQPVSIGSAGAAVLRISSSARLITRCWSADPAIAASRLQAEMEKAAAIVGKVSLAAQSFPQMEP